MLNDKTTYINIDVNVKMEWMTVIENVIYISDSFSQLFPELENQMNKSLCICLFDFPKINN